MKYALLLTCYSNRVIIIAPHYNPAIEDQAIDRCHRIGQTKPVYVTRLVIPDTVEDRIQQIQERKRELFGRSIDGQGVNPAALKFTKDHYRFVFGLTTQCPL